MSRERCVECGAPAGAGTGGAGGLCLDCRPMGPLPFVTSTTCRCGGGGRYTLVRFDADHLTCVACGVVRRVYRIVRPSVGMAS
jgi:hypothetical protein